VAFKDLRLSLMTFPQEWVPGPPGITVNVLLLPTGDPTVPDPQLGGPAFSGSPRTLRAVFITSLAELPSPNAPPGQVKTFPLATVAPGGAPALFASLAAQYNIVPGPTASVPNVRIKKALPQSYIDAFPFEQPRTSDAIVGDGFGCALVGKNPNPNDPPPNNDISWGQVFSYALHNPDVAEKLGLLYQNLLVPVTTTDVTSGGWLYVSLDAADPYAAKLNTDIIKLYAARVPALTTARQVFAAALFPVVASIANPAPYDAAEIEAQTYDDGFAQIVHCNQPATVDAAAGDETQIVPGTDAGIQVGWDDEQVTIWNNRQLDNLRARRNGGTPEAEAPLGVLGYRVDVQDPKTGNWFSLCSAEGTQPPPEDSVHPAPMRSTDPADLEAWLPRYFAQWRGKSLVSQDPDGMNLTGGKKTIPGPSPASVLPRLLFGNTYSFRVRFADLTGGGPLLKDGPQNPAPAPVGACPFKRYLPPKAARIQSTLQNNALSEILVWRPLISYPELLFAGVDSSAVAGLLSQVADAKNVRQALGANDPDVKRVRIAVEARTPAHDTSNPDSLDGPFREIYSFETDFPPYPADPVPPTPGTSPASEAIQFDIQAVDVANISTMTAPAATARPAPQPLPIPTARDVRIVITAIADSLNPAYFGNEAAKAGATAHLDARIEASKEDALFVAQPDAKEIVGIFLQPPANNDALNELSQAFNLTPPQTTTDPAQLLAQQLSIAASGLTLTGLPGQRIVFGSSLSLRHTLSGDHSSIAFAAQSELLSKWIIAIILELNRDWTWDGLADASLEIVREDLTGGGSVLTDLGPLYVRRTVAQIALQGAFPDRRKSTRLIFFDALDPHPPANKFPVSQQLRYRVTPQLKTLPAPASKELELTLPIASAPVQTPTLVSAGLALTPYHASSDYSSTLPRSRALWLELDGPPLDPQDGYFARVLAYGIDPLLASEAAGAVQPQEPPLGVDPEPIRVIAPGASVDTAGLGAMTPLIRSKLSNRHYLLPLPPGTTEDSPELFGFWTYELRVGHYLDPNTQQPVWSTAQARFGRPLRVTGVQHPAPQLRCQALRAIDEQGQKIITATAPFATPVLNRRVLFREVPSSRLWFLMYTQVLQADGASNRNLLIDRRPAVVRHPVSDTNPIGIASPPFLEAEVTAILAEYTLPPNSPLSVLAVELLPAPNPEIEDPLGSSLGEQRILRTSPLVKVADRC
jgi:hypothetical protein